MLCTLCTKWGIPASAPPQQLTLVMLSDKHTRNAHLWCNPSDHMAGEVWAQDVLVRTPLWLTMMKALLRGHGLHDHKLEDGSAAGSLALCPQVLIFPPPLQGHHLMVTSLLYRREVIIWPIKDGNGKRTFELGLIVTMSCHPWDSNVKVSSYFSSLTHLYSCNHTKYFSLTLEQNPPNPPQKETPVPCMPCEQTPWPPIPGPSGTQWSKDLFREPSQHKEPPIQSSESQVPLHQDISTCEPEPEVAPTQSMEEPFGLAGIYQLATNPNDSSSNHPRLNQPNLVEASPIAPHDSLCGCDSSK
ncbi:hypothetical protein O181_104647 [Austropuccinia psidii MF-1]|uniref:Uncharacterized protein n=1 Tax=Austropuccinia psidii MF-1 TaxID=1389203 RepID=A0A9Q3JNH2_9BASI|nr:hypothetical protein [Austropuccinia psidii MF-1]